MERLKQVESGEITLDIIGPVDDEAYWQKCKAAIAGMPKNVSVKAHGAFPNNEALRRMAESHFFAMPTLNENFGYVFIEALAAGCPILISDNTVWTDVDESQVGWQIPLSEPERFTRKIKDCVEMDNAEYLRMSANARKYAEDWLSRGEINEATARVLSRALEGRS